MDLSHYEIFLGWSSLKSFADDKINETEKMKFGMERVENIMGKRRKCCLPAYSPFPTMFSKGSSIGPLKVLIVGKRVDRVK